MKRLGYLLFAVLAITLMLGGNALATPPSIKATAATISSLTTPMRIPRVFRMERCVSSMMLAIQDASPSRVIQNASAIHPCGRISTCSMTAKRCGRAAPAKSPQTVCFRNP